MVVVLDLDHQSAIRIDRVSVDHENNIEIIEDYEKVAQGAIASFSLTRRGSFRAECVAGETRPSAASTARIEVTAAVIERLRAAYERQFGQPPDAEEMRAQVTAHIREEVLCREAVAMGLDRDDTIVRRRLAQKMEFLTDDIVIAAVPKDAAVREFFEKNAAHYAKSARDVSVTSISARKSAARAQRRRRPRRSRHWRKAQATRRWAIRFCTGSSLPSANRTTSSQRSGRSLRSSSRRADGRMAWTGSVELRTAPRARGSSHGAARGEVRRSARDGVARFQ